MMKSYKKFSKIHIISDYILYFDGASKNNPGLGGAGCILYKLNNDGKSQEIWRCSHFLGYVTNNEAEYKALLLGLYKINDLGISNVCVRGDSLLVINQVRKLYKTKSKNLICLNEKCQEYIDKIFNISFQHIDRKHNEEADLLANLALKNNNNNHFSYQESLNQNFTNDESYILNKIVNPEYCEIYDYEDIKNETSKVNQKYKNIFDYYDKCTLYTINNVCNYKN